MTNKILVVDDDRVFLELVHHILEEYVSGEIRTFSSSIEAIEFIQQNEALSLVICDWHMPKADGLEVLKVLRKRCPDTPFLMLTGTPKRSVVLAAKQGGANGFIAKPFKDHELLEKVSNLLH